MLIFDTTTEGIESTDSGTVVLANSPDGTNERAVADVGYVNTTVNNALGTVETELSGV